MRQGALLVNLSRGGMVDETALYDALALGSLGGAGLDVFACEPYKGPLCDLERVILTPHSATFTAETRTAMELESVEKAIDFLGGRLGADERMP